MHKESLSTARVCNMENLAPGRKVHTTVMQRFQVLHHGNPTGHLYFLLKIHTSLKASMYTWKIQVTSGIYTLVFHERALHN